MATGSCEKGLAIDLVCVAISRDRRFLCLILRQTFNMQKFDQQQTGRRSRRHSYKDSSQPFVSDSFFFKGYRMKRISKSPWSYHFSQTAQLQCIVIKSGEDPTSNVDYAEAVSYTHLQTIDNENYILILLCVRVFTYILLDNKIFWFN